MSVLKLFDMQIICKYFRCSTDFTNIMKVCKKYKQLVQSLHFNPIRLTKLNFNLFENIETQYIFKNCQGCCRNPACFDSGNHTEHLYGRIAACGSVGYCSDGSKRYCRIDNCRGIDIFVREICRRKQFLAEDRYPQGKRKAMEA